VDVAQTFRSANRKNRGTSERDERSVRRRRIPGHHEPVAVALFVPDPEGGQNVLRYAAGAHADKLIGLRRPAQVGIAGWVAANCRSVLNAEPVFDLGYRANFAPALRSSVAVPLLDNGTVVAVLVLYSKNLLAFTDEQAAMLELLGPRLAVTLADVAAVQDDLSPDPGPVMRLVAPGVRA